MGMERRFLCMIIAEDAGGVKFDPVGGSAISPIIERISYRQLEQEAGNGLRENYLGKIRLKKANLRSKSMAAAQ